MFHQKTPLINPADERIQFDLISALTKSFGLGIYCLRKEGVFGFPMDSKMGV